MLDGMAACRCEGIGKRATDAAAGIDVYITGVVDNGPIDGELTCCDCRGVAIQLHDIGGNSDRSVDIGRGGDMEVLNRKIRPQFHRVHYRHDIGAVVYPGDVALNLRLLMAIQRRPAEAVIAGGSRQRGKVLSEDWIAVGIEWFELYLFEASRRSRR
jgi:hypothetical protein